MDKIITREYVPVYQHRRLNENRGLEDVGKSSEVDGKVKNKTILPDTMMFQKGCENKLPLLKEKEPRIPHETVDKGSEEELVTPGNKNFESENRTSDEKLGLNDNELKRFWSYESCNSSHDSSVCDDDKHTKNEISERESYSPFHETAHLKHSQKNNEENTRGEEQGISECVCRENCRLSNEINFNHNECDECGHDLSTLNDSRQNNKTMEDDDLSQVGLEHVVHNYYNESAFTQDLINFNENIDKSGNESDLDGPSCVDRIQYFDADDICDSQIFSQTENGPHLSEIRITSIGTENDTPAPNFVHESFFLSTENENEFFSLTDISDSNNEVIYYECDTSQDESDVEADAPTFASNNNYGEDYQNISEESKNMHSDPVVNSRFIVRRIEGDGVGVKDHSATSEPRTKDAVPTSENVDDIQAASILNYQADGIKSSSSKRVLFSNRVVVHCFPSQNEKSKSKAGTQEQSYFCLEDIDSRGDDEFFSECYDNEGREDRDLEGVNEIIIHRYADSEEESDDDQFIPLAAERSTENCKDPVRVDEETFRNHSKDLDISKLTEMVYLDDSSSTRKEEIDGISAGQKSIREAELEDAINELEEEIKAYKKSILCKICLNREMDIVFLPCAHLLACFSCSRYLICCPICQKDILDKTRVYKV